MFSYIYEGSFEGPVGGLEPDLEVDRRVREAGVVVIAVLQVDVAASATSKRGAEKGGEQNTEK